MIKQKIDQKNLMNALEKIDVQENKINRVHRELKRVCEKYNI